MPTRDFDKGPHEFRAPPSAADLSGKRCGDGAVSGAWRAALLGDKGAPMDIALHHLRGAAGASGG